jgi:hypothetical protein
MKDLEVKLDINGETRVTDGTKSAIEGEFAIIGQHRLHEIWKGQIPPRERASIEVHGCCASIMDDWECTIFGKSSLDCLVGLSLLHEFLSRHFDKPIGFRVLYPSGKQQPVDTMIRHERRKARFFRIGIFIVTVLVSGLIGYYIERIITGWGVNNAKKRRRSEYSSSNSRHFCPVSDTYLQRRYL